ncbi:MAG: SRPBCC family protein [Alphaproteobacteria bacterium]|jgi:phenylpropionate dioxygenase-like ring-hydroxylating dioxygenase large terminal subunit|nr:SRPBCC family protein [Alphaproteobacteria bacterium]|tara:strand:- start:127 stop:1479 length:1353 start_codon:yes stop_codon:yes gene_type:complete
MRFADPAEYVIDDPEGGVFRVHRDVYTDRDLFEAELRNIFEGTWVYLCHDSQVRQPFDFYRARIGRRSVIVSRDEHGEVHGFFNTCRHRGATLCQTESGNTKYHVCNYHGWAYDAAGKNINIKDKDKGCYREAFDEQDHNLIPLPRFDSYRGFVFASLNPDVPSLDDHLGDGKVLIDLVADQGVDGMEVVPGRSDYTYNANWKLQMDNGMDPYHLTSTHSTFMKVVQRRAGGESANDQVESPDFRDRFAMKAGMYTLRNGHSMIWNDHPKPEQQPLWGMIDRVRENAGEVKAKWMLRSRNITIFPNLQFNDSSSLVLRSFIPLAPDKTEMKVYSFAPVDEPDECRRRRVRQHEDFFNSSGMATPDDTIVYADCQEGYLSYPGDYLQSFERGMATLIEGPDEEALELGIDPVTSLSGNFLGQGETAYHGPYREWVRLMRAGHNREKSMAAE